MIFWNSMNESNNRITQGDDPPSDSEIVRWIGKEAFKYWKQVTRLIGRNYPGVFVPEWLFGGKKHGWSLRYKKSKSFCTLIPEKERFALLIVFGAEERANVDAIRESLSKQIRREYDNATTYHDGKWVLLTVNSATVVEDVRKLLAIKRKLKKSTSA
jgi:hypothetical protein